MFSFITKQLSEPALSFLARLYFFCTKVQIELSHHGVGVSISVAVSQNVKVFGKRF